MTVYSYYTIVRGDLSNVEVLKQYKERPNDTEAREAMYQYYRRFLYRLAAPFSSCDSAIDTDDLVQEGYFALLEAADRYLPECGKAFTAWARWFVLKAYYLALGAHTTECEDGKRRYRTTPRFASLDAPLDEAGEICLGDTIADESAINPEEKAMSNGIAPLVWACVDKLPPTKAQVIRMCYQQGHTLKDAAEVMGISYTGAYAEHGEALRQLRRMREIRQLKSGESGYFKGKSVSDFQRTRMSSTEDLAFRRIERYKALG